MNDTFAQKPIHALVWMAVIAVILIARSLFSRKQTRRRKQYYAIIDRNIENAASAVSHLHTHHHARTKRA